MISSFRLSITSDTHWESKVDRVVIALSDLEYRQYFERREYGLGLTSDLYHPPPYLTPEESYRQWNREPNLVSESTRDWSKRPDFDSFKNASSFLFVTVSIGGLVFLDGIRRGLVYVIGRKGSRRVTVLEVLSGFGIHCGQYY